MITCFNILSAFKQFHQLYREYQQSTDSEYSMPEMVDCDGHINTDVYMPIDMISEKLPALKVSHFLVGAKFACVLGTLCLQYQCQEI